MMIAVFYLNKKCVTGRIGNGEKYVEIMVPAKYLSDFWRTLQMPLINCEIILILTWSKNCIWISGAIDNQVPIFAITDTNLHFQL